VDRGGAGVWHGARGCCGWCLQGGATVMKLASLYVVCVVQYVRFQRRCTAPPYCQAAGELLSRKGGRGLISYEPDNRTTSAWTHGCAFRAFLPALRGHVRCKPPLGTRVPLGAESFARGTYRLRKHMDRSAVVYLTLASSTCLSGACFCTLSVSAAAPWQKQTSWLAPRRP
jgi:hypothetical protein